MASSGSQTSRPASINSMAIVRLFRCITGPKLRRLYYQGYRDQVGCYLLPILIVLFPKSLSFYIFSLLLIFVQGVAYEPNKAERYADNVILAVSRNYLSLKIK